MAYTVACSGGSTTGTSPQATATGSAGTTSTDASSSTSNMAAPADPAADSGIAYHASDPFCGSAPADSAPCFTNEECGDQQCTYRSGCQLGCVGPQDQCDDAIPCPEGYYCTGTPAARSSCSCGGGTYCQANCASDADCAASDQCASEGSCVPRPCGEGYECPEHWVCAPDADVVDSHGCRQQHCTEAGSAECGVNQMCHPDVIGSGCTWRTCTTAADCDCGACLLDVGRCMSNPGYCSSNVAVPG